MQHTTRTATTKTATTRTATATKNAQPIKLHFIYPNGDIIIAEASIGQSIYDIANANKIEMDKNVPKTCMVTFVKNDANDVVYNAYDYILQLKDDGISVFLKLIRIKYFDQNNNKYILHAFNDENMNDLIDRDDQERIDLPFSCGGNLSCSTCHCKIDPKYKNTINRIDDDEEDYLQYVQGTDNSRMGCKIVFPLEADGIKITHPKNKIYKL